jgi:hypothetical protein|tara:strand:+ start:1188 stop:1823 length:636 start_codon:yes stop_codon:yes gene_type:complete
MPTPIENTLAIILSPDNKMRDKTPYVYDIPESNLCWLHNCGSASKSVMSWLKKDYGDMRKMNTEQLKENQKSAFVLLSDPKYRWFTGVIEWASCFEDYAWFRNEKIMEWWPHFDRFTLAPWEVIEQTKVEHFIKVGPDLNETMQDFAREHDLKMYGNFPYIKPRWRTVKYIERMAKALKPALQNEMRRRPELEQKLDEYLEKDYQYYNKAK